MGGIDSNTSSHGSFICDMSIDHTPRKNIDRLTVEADGVGPVLFLSTLRKISFRERKRKREME